jgi:hypothetical protein
VGIRFNFRQLDYGQSLFCLKKVHRGKSILHSQSVISNLDVFQFNIFRVDDIGYGAVAIERFPQSPESLYEDGAISQDGYLLYQEQSSVRLGHIK